MSKSKTDIFWNDRSGSGEIDVSKVNIDDLPQREIETRFVEKNLGKDLNILEVGCGNGFLSKRLAAQVKSIDAFDYSENMIKQANDVHSVDNVNYFHDNVLEPKNIPNNTYDVIVCVRVLINLRNFEEQKKAIRNIIEFMGPKTKLVMVEGFKDGFDNLNMLRSRVDLPSFDPAKINFYSNLAECVKFFSEMLTIEDKMNTGLFDMMTRIVNPLLNGVENSSGPSEFHKKILPLCLQENPDGFEKYARLHGFVLTRK